MAGKEMTYADLSAKYSWRGKPQREIEELIAQVANGGLEGLAAMMVNALEWDRLSRQNKRKEGRT